LNDHVLAAGAYDSKQALGRDSFQDFLCADDFVALDLVRVVQAFFEDVLSPLCYDIPYIANDSYERRKVT
jgi:hypothetical protein